MVVEPGAGDLQNCHIGQLQPAAHDILRGAFVLDGNNLANYCDGAGRNIAELLTVPYLEEIIDVSPVPVDRPLAREVKGVGPSV